MQRHVVIAPFGNDRKLIFQILRTFHTEKIVLVTNKENHTSLEDIEKKAECLKRLGLVDARGSRKKAEIKLTEQGETPAEGYL